MTLCRRMDFCGTFKCVPSNDKNKRLHLMTTVDGFGCVYMHVKIILLNQSDK